MGKQLTECDLQHTFPHSHTFWNKGNWWNWSYRLSSVLFSWRTEHVCALWSLGPWIPAEPPRGSQAHEHYHQKYNDNCTMSAMSCTLWSVYELDKNHKKCLVIIVLYLWWQRKLQIHRKGKGRMCVCSLYWCWETNGCVIRIYTWVTFNLY